MVHRPGLLLWLLNTLVYRHVDVPEGDVVERLRAHGERGTVVYVSRSRSVLDYLFWNFVLRGAGLGLCAYAVGVTTLPFRALGALSARWTAGRAGAVAPEGVKALAQAVGQGRTAFLFLGKARTLIQRNADFSRDHVVELLGLQGEGPDKPILLVPVQVMWRPRPQKLRPSLLDSILGSAERPGRIRQVWSVLLSPRMAQVQVGEAIDLGRLLDERGAEAGDAAGAEALARKVRGALHLHLARTARAAIGPRVKERRRLLDEIVRGLDNGGELQAIADRSGRSVPALREEALELLDGIAADFRWGVLRFLYWLMAPVWSRIYDGFEVDDAGFLELQEAARKGPVILMPTHKSHIDYLILSWVFLDRGLVPPHIAAGANMNFFPFGLLFRRAGAFFLRRSFRGDPLYPVVFRAYMRKMLREGYNLEFFIEGGRSRSGKVLHPRFGLLTYVFDAVLDPGGARDVRIAPVSIGYERIVEAAAYEKELGGGGKEVESARGLLKARRVLAKRYGRLYLEFQSPKSLREWITEQGADPDDCPKPQRAALVRSLAYDVAWRLQRNSTVSPIALAATVLLSHPKRGIDRSSLLVKVGYLHALAAERSARFSRTIRTAMSAAQARIVAATDDPLAEGPAALAERPDSEEAPGSWARGEALGDAMDEALALFIGDKSLQLREYGEDDAIYSVVPDRRIRLDFHRCGLTPLFAPELIVATASLACAERDDCTPSDLAQRLSRILKFEFVFRSDAPFEALYGDAVLALQGMGLLDGAGRPAPDANPALSFLRNMLRPFLEAYYVVAIAMRGPGPKPGAKGMLAVAERLYLQGEIDLPEARSGVVLDNAGRALGGLDESGLAEAEADLRAFLRQR